MSDSAPTPGAGEPSRRTLVGGLLGLGVAAPVVAACGSSGSGGSSGGSGSSGGAGSGSGGGGKAAGALAKTSQIPVGGGKIFSSAQVVVTQPTAGHFKAFSAVCTHQGCTVSEITGGDIDCTCHGSKFSITDGSVVNGPATKPLQQLTVTVKGQSLSVS